LEQIKKMIHNRQLEYITPPSSATNMSVSQTMSKMLNELVQLSLNCANDSMHTSLCLQFLPQKIATACVYLAGHFAKVRPTSNSWLDVLEPPIEVEALSSICLQILDLIAERKGGANEDKEYQQIRTELEQMQQKQQLPRPPAANPPSSSNPATASAKRSPPPPPPGLDARDPKRQRQG
jgi:hypothetical protein